MESEVKRTALALAAVLLAMPAPARGQSITETVQRGTPGLRQVVSRVTDAPPKIDGVLDDACWKTAEGAGGFFRVTETTAARERTAFFFAHDAANLYIACAIVDDKTQARKRERDKGTWEDDCVEIFLDPERGRKDRFHFVVNALGMVYDASLGKAAWNAVPDVAVGAQQRPGEGWTLELAIPFKSLGLQKAPLRGETWDLKLAREDYDTEGGTPRLSSWQFIAQSFADAGAFGRLVFVDPNCCANGDFSQGYIAPREGESWTRTQWRITPDYMKTHDADLILDETQGHDTKPCGKVLAPKGNAQAQVIAQGTPFRKYRIAGWVNLDGLTATGRVEMYTDRNNKVTATPAKKGWQQLETYAATADASAIVVVFTLHSGSGSFLVDDVSVVEVENTPRDADALCFTGNAAGEQARNNRRVEGRYTYCELGTAAPFFPQDVERGTPDVELYAGWIPFSKGKLTDGLPTYSQYHQWTQSPGKSLLFDLGADRFVTDIDLEPVVRGIKNVRIYVKAEKDAHYTLVAQPACPGGVVESGPINATLRHIRIDADGESGLREVRIWGKERKEAVAARPLMIQPRKGSESGAGGPALAERTFALFPTPKEFRATGGMLPLKDGVRISLPAVAADRSVAVADDLAGQLRLNAGIEVVVVRDAPGATIRLSIQTEAGGLEDKGRDGYRLSISTRGVEIVAGGESGLAFGCHSLVQCLAETDAGPALRGAEVRDWPTYPFRALQIFTRQLENPATLRAVQTMARMKMNHLVLMGTEASMIPVCKQLLVLGMDTIPRAASMPAGGWYSDTIELNPGEAVQDLPSRSRVNPCPSHPKTWEHIDVEVARAAPFPGDYVYINCDEMYQEQKGARWNVCPLCAARKMNGGDLFAELLQGIYDRFARIGKKPVMLNTMYGIPYKDMNKAFGKIPKDITIMIWHPWVQEGLVQLGYPVGEFFDDDNWSINPAGRNVVGGFVPADGGFKIERAAIIAEALWSGKYPDLSSDAALRRIGDVMTKVHEAEIDTPLPSTRATADRFVPIDLAAAATTSLADVKAGDGLGFLDLGPGTDLSFMRGERVLDGVPFRIGGADGKDIVMIENRGALDPRFPSEMRIRVGRKAASLVFLHTMTVPLSWTYAAQLTYAGTYIVTYADNSRAAYPIEYKRNILEYDALSPRNATGYKSRLVTIPGAVPAWKGTLPGGDSLLLMAAEWVNPFPDREIDSIVMRSTSRMFGTRLALFALTSVTAVDRDARLWSGRKTPALPPEASRTIPNGLREIDLAGGDLSPEKEYVAPDGTRLTVTESYTLRGATFIAPMKPGYVVLDGNRGWQVYAPGPQSMTISFPAPRALAAVSLLGLPQSPEYIFGGPVEVNYVVECSADGGVWQEVAQRRGYLADRDWESVHAFAPRAVKSLRITVTPANPRAGSVRGLARIRLYEPGGAP